MSSNNFKKPPLSEKDKTKKADEFLNFIDTRQDLIEQPKERQITKKESTKSILLRLPESLKGDLDEISNLTGISINAICLELLRPSVKRKLKELKED